MYPQRCSFFLIWFILKTIKADDEKLTQNAKFAKFTKIDNAANIYIGNGLYQKISQFLIDEDHLDCQDKYLPIIFDMIKEDKNSLLVKGLLTQSGTLVSKQDNISTCKIFKK